MQSRRRQRFLDYIVNETLAGRGDRFKGYNIALEVFDRPDEFDPDVDPIVRIEAARLRDKLREYYEADGQSDPIRIELPKGSYTPNSSSAKTPQRREIESKRRKLRPQRTRAHCAKRWKGWQAPLRSRRLLLALAAAGLWFVVSNRQPEVKVEKAERILPEVPAVAVLPFAI